MPSFAFLSIKNNIRYHSVQCKLEEKVYFSCRLLFGSDYEISLPQGIVILILKLHNH